MVRSNYELGLERQTFGVVLSERGAPLDVNVLRHVVEAELEVLVRVLLHEE
jgi:hypothetical protein